MQHLLLSEIIVTLSNSMQLLAELKMQNVQSQDLENSTPPPDITHACPHVMQILCVHNASRLPFGSHVLSSFNCINQVFNHFLRFGNGEMTHILESVK